MITETQKTKADGSARTSDTAAKKRRIRAASQSPKQRVQWTAGATSVVLSGVFALLYLATRTQFYSVDAVRIGNDLVRYHHQHTIDDLYQPTHLLYEIFASIGWAITRVLGYKGGPLPVLEDINCACGGIGLGLLYLTLRAILTRSRSLAMLVPVALGLSFGYWIVATDARPEMPGIAAMIAAIYMIIRCMLLPIRRRSATAGLVGAVATLLYLPSGMLLIVGILAIFLAEYSQGTEDEERLARNQNLAIYTSSFVLPVVFAYLLVGLGIQRFDSPSDWRAWFADGADRFWNWSPHPLANLRLDVYAFRRALFVEPGTKTGTFHLEEQGGPLQSVLYWTTLAGWFTAVYAILSATMFLVRTHYKSFLIVALAIVFIYAGLFTVVSPGAYTNWLPVTTASAIIMAIAGSYYRGKRGGMLWLAGLTAWTVIFAFSNFELFVRPHMEASENPWLGQAELIESHTQPGDVIVLSGTGDEVTATEYFPYFARRSVFSLADSLTAHGDNVTLTSRDLQGTVVQAMQSGHRVFALGNIWQDADVRGRLRDEHGVSAPQLLFVGLRRAPAWRDPDDPDSIVWKLIPSQRPI